MFYTFKAIQETGIYLVMNVFPDMEAGRNMVTYHSVKLLKLNVFIFDLYHGDTTADVDPGKVWHEFVMDSHGKPDRAYFSRMYIWHDFYFCIAVCFNIAQHLQLGNSIGIYGGRWIICSKYSGRSIFAIYDLLIHVCKNSLSE